MSRKFRDLALIVSKKTVTQKVLQNYEVTEIPNDGQTKSSIVPPFQSGAINSLSRTSATNYCTPVPQDNFCSALTTTDVIQ